MAQRMSCSALLAVLAAFLARECHGQTVTGYPCPNACSGHGLCNINHCSCFEGYIGGDCSQKRCPMGNAWSDVASDVDVAHNLVECSGRGTCDRESGMCLCESAFTGKSCSISKCPNNCWGRGRCVSMNYLAASKDPGEGVIYAYSDVWDADKLFGCVCDQGYSGYDCSLRDCPYGDDPMTTGQVDETQILMCSSEDGSFTLTFRGHTSEPIPYTAQLTEFQTIVEAIPGVGRVNVEFSETGLAVCQGTSKNQVVSITFLEHFGNIPALVSHSKHSSSCSIGWEEEYDYCSGSPLQIETDGGSIVATTGGTIISVPGDKENTYCSRRGRCDRSSGVCTCYDNFATSDGRGESGDRGDCGFMSAFEITACPGLISCSGHGTCASVSTFSCTCSVGWTGGDCSERTCAKGKSWFDKPIENNRAHQLVECSNMGTCDVTTGECRCHSGFTGASCDKMSCPGTPTACSGHGTCLSMAQLAEFNLANGEADPKSYGLIPNDPFRWDYDMIHGCLCDEGWEGHSCSLMSCPTGDDPETGFTAQDEQFFEVQAFKCGATLGSFILQFRSADTEPIPHDVNQATLKSMLEALPTITEVEIEYSDGLTACTNDDSNVVTVTFTQELGNLPLMKSFTTSANGGSLEHSPPKTPYLNVVGGGASLDGVSTRDGTKENLVCSARGVCDHDTGLCSCFAGYGSSNGNMEMGHRGDCGWRIPWYTPTEEF